MGARLLLTVLLIVPGIAGCLIDPLASEPQGLVATGQPVVDAALRLGVQDQLVGIPSWVVLDEPLDAQRLGRPFTIPAEQVLSLAPARVLDQPHPLVSGPDRAALQATLARAGIPVTTLPVAPSVATATASLWAVANATGTDASAAAIELREGLATLAAETAGLEERPRVLVLFPAGLTAGTGTDAHLILELAGARNVAAEAGLEGYRQITDEAVRRVGVDLVMATATMRASPDEVAALPMLEGTRVSGNASRVLVVDPSRTTRVGPFLDHAAGSLAAWMHRSIGPERIQGHLAPSKVPACAEVGFHAAAPTTGHVLGETIPPGTFTVPDVAEGHYRFRVLPEAADQTAPRPTTVDLVLSVEGTRCET